MRGRIDNDPTPDRRPKPPRSKTITWNVPWLLLRGQLPPALQTTGYDAEIWRALPPDVRREQEKQLAASARSPKGGRRPLSSSSSSGAAKRGIKSSSSNGCDRALKRLKPSPHKSVGSPLTRFPGQQRGRRDRGVEKEFVHVCIVCMYCYAGKQVSNDGWGLGLTMMTQKTNQTFNQ